MVKITCPYCKQKTTGKKIRWKKGEKTKKGYYPKIQEYWECYKCERGFMRLK